MLLKSAAILVICGGLSACATRIVNGGTSAVRSVALTTASLARSTVMSYTGPGFPTEDGGRHFRVSVHPKEDVLLIQARLKDAASNERADLWSTSVWRSAADSFMAPAGCRVVEIAPMGLAAVSWQARYKCPDGVDLHFLVLAQKSELRRGEPLRP